MPTPWEWLSLFFGTGITMLLLSKPRSALVLIAFGAAMFFLFGPYGLGGVFLGFLIVLFKKKGKA